VRVVVLVVLVVLVLVFGSMASVQVMG